MFDIFPPSPSYPLAEALRRFGDAELVAWLDQHENSEDKKILDLYRERERALERSILPDIRKGALVATAFEGQISISSRRQRISPDIWGVLNLNIKGGTGSYRGLQLFDIEIQEDEIAARIYGVRARRSASRSIAAAEPEPLEKPEAEVRLSEDLELLRIGDQEWRLTGEIQQDIIKQLVDAYPEALKTAKVLSHAGSNADTIGKAFTNSPNWPTLGKFIQRENGYSRLLSEPQEDAAREVSQSAEKLSSPARKSTVREA